MLSFRLRVMKYFAFHYTYSDNTDVVDATRPAHREFIAKQLELGRIVGSGPLVDAGKALIIVQLPDTADAAEAVSLMNQDPYWQNNALLSREVHEWNPVSRVFP